MGNVHIKIEYVDHGLVIEELPLDEYNYVTYKKRILNNKFNNHKYITIRQGIIYSVWKICPAFSVND